MLAEGRGARPSIKAVGLGGYNSVLGRHTNQLPLLCFASLSSQAAKEIGRELKKVKAFLLQKLVKRCRKLRQKKAGGGSSRSGGGKEEEEGRCAGLSSLSVVGTL